MTNVVLKKAKVQHEVLYTELMDLLKKHVQGGTPVEEVLAIVSNLAGKLVAMCDQRKYTSVEIMKIVSENIQYGNKQMVDELMSKTAGNA